MTNIMTTADLCYAAVPRIFYYTQVDFWETDKVWFCVLCRFKNE